MAAQTVQDLINQYAGYLQTPGTYIDPNQTADQSYANYAAPQQAVMDQLTKQMQQYNQRYTIDPFQSQYADQAAAGNAMNMGNGAYNYETARAGVEQPLQNKVQGAQDQYNNMVTQGYQKQITDFYNNILNSGYKPTS